MSNINNALLLFRNALPPNLLLLINRELNTDMGFKVGESDNHNTTKIKQ